MKSAPGEFALLGGRREFSNEVHVGQLYFPQWERYEEAMRLIIGRHYYTNHGPLVRELEARLESFFEVRNVVTVTNATLAIYLALLAIGLEAKSKVLMPSFTFVATAQAAVLAGLDPVFCDVEPVTHHLTPSIAEAALEEGVSALCAVNLWGGSAPVVELEAWAAAHGLPVLFDSAHGFGVERSEGKLGRFGRAEVFSFHATKILSATEGGCVCTDDDELAELIRNMRSNYGIRRPLAVPLTVNARMSEAQAAVALMNLDDVEHHLANNKHIFDTYRSLLSDVPGIRLVEPSRVTRSNHQYVVIEVADQEYGVSRDLLWTLLRAEGVRARRYFTPGIHRSTPFDVRYPQYVEALPVTDALCARVLQLPIGAHGGAEDAERIANLVSAVHVHREGLLARAG